MYCCCRPLIQWVDGLLFCWISFILLYFWTSLFCSWLVGSQRLFSLIFFWHFLTRYNLFHNQRHLTSQMKEMLNCSRCFITSSCIISLCFLRLQWTQWSCCCCCWSSPHCDPRTWGCSHYPSEVTVGAALKKSDLYWWAVKGRCDCMCVCVCVPQGSISGPVVFTIYRRIIRAWKCAVSCRKAARFL